MILAGLPAAMQFDGIDFVTRLIAPITELSPILTPLRTMTRLPSQTLFPIRTGCDGPGELIAKLG